MLVVCLLNFVVLQAKLQKKRLMEISTRYNPEQVEQKWYQYWLKHEFFRSKPDDREPFTIVIPPPNVTGVLHMGHMLNNTIQDVLVRRARMQGKNACWVPGTDHASIATEAKVVAMLKEKGIAKKDLTREEFLKYAFEWKEKYGGIILEQLKKLGCSCDWSRTRFTMEEELSKAVIKAFVHLYRKGWIYRGMRMVNWDPIGQTALSDEEVIFKETKSKMAYVKYFVPALNEYLIIATVRPETIPADVAVCVNPNDERYQKFIGKTAIVPLINREVPIIADEKVDIAFGTGVLKITPAHDPADYEIAQKHNLPIIDTIALDGTMTEAIGIPKYVGKDRFLVRKEIIKDLQDAELLLKVEDYTHQVGTSERTGAVIEPKLSMQWWLKMDQIAKPAYENVMNDTIRFFPEKFKNMYRSWMENPKDWCISRQLWWGQRIPAYYDEQGNFVVAETYEEALQEYKKLFPNTQNITLKQDEDVLDTWFSSWLWPISVFDGFKDPNNEDIRYYYPTNVLVTGFDIIFFWVARMIMAGYEFRGEKPFKDVYFTGLIRDRLGRKMSKSLGNSPDALKLMEIYSADGVRFGVLFSSAAGNDLLFDTPVPKSQKKEDIEAFLNSPESHQSKLCEQGRNFANKIWNSFRLIKTWQISQENTTTAHPETLQWFEARLNQALTEIEEHFEKYRISEVLHVIYKLFWEDFCSWYLEIIKPEHSKAIDQNTYEKTLEFFDKLLRILHPFMPFITEEVWQNILPRKEGDSICIAPYPKSTTYDVQILKQAELAFEAVSQIRNTRNAYNISQKEKVEIAIRKSDNEATLRKWQKVIEKLSNTSIEFVDTKPEKTIKFLVKTEEFFAKIDVEIDLEKVRKDLEYYKGFKESVLKKLSNEKFLTNAKPEIIANERKKLADAEAKIKALEEMLK